MEGRGKLKKMSGECLGILCLKFGRHPEMQISLRTFQSTNIVKNYQFLFQTTIFRFYIHTYSQKFSQNKEFTNRNFCGYGISLIVIMQCKLFRQKNWMPLPVNNEFKDAFVLSNICYLFHFRARRCPNQICNMGTGFTFKSGMLHCN